MFYFLILLGAIPLLAVLTYGIVWGIVRIFEILLGRID